MGVRAVVGLGNPGPRYAGTRHNIGYDVVDALAARAGGVFKRSWRLCAHSCTVPVSGREILLVKPRAYMNRSGETVGLLRRRRGLPPEEILVVVDDAELELGRIRVRARGSAGGHNGLKSIIERIGCDTFPRIRIGVGGRRPGDDLADHVLSRFLPEEREIIDGVIPRSADAVLYAVEHGVEAAMNRFNARRIDET